MNKNKFNLRNVLAIAICLVVSTAFVGCDNKEKPENSIVGKWSETSPHFGFLPRIIVFTEDLRVEQYFDHIFPDVVVNYSIYGNNITFVPYPYRGGPTFEFILNGNSLIIKRFSNPFSLTEEARFDVHFRRIE